MSRILALGLLAVAAFAADKKSGPAEASGDDLRFSATVILDRAEIQQALGADLGDGFVVLHVKVTPKGDKPVRLSPDDFTLLSRKDGERCPALTPSQIAGRGSITVKAAAEQPNSWGNRVSAGTIWSGVGPQIRRQPDNDKKAGDKTGEKDSDKDAKSGETASAAPEGGQQNSLLAALKAKSLPDDQIKGPVEGLLYFRMDGKNKVKDLSVLYKGAGDRLVADFK